MFTVSTTKWRMKYDAITATVGNGGGGGDDSGSGYIHTQKKNSKESSV